MIHNSQPFMTKDNLNQLFTELELDGTSDNEKLAKDATSEYCCMLLEYGEYTPVELRPHIVIYYQGYLDCLNRSSHKYSEIVDTFCEDVVIKAK